MEEGLYPGLPFLPRPVGRRRPRAASPLGTASPRHHVAAIYQHLVFHRVHGHVIGTDRRPFFVETYTDPASIAARWSGLSSTRWAPSIG